MTGEQQIIAKLDELVRAVRSSSDADRCLDLHGVADFLDYSYTYVRDRISKLPGFPSPITLDSDAHPRWLRSDLVRWAKARAQRTRR